MFRFIGHRADGTMVFNRPRRPHCRTRFTVRLLAGMGLHLIATLPAFPADPEAFSGPAIPFTISVDGETIDRSGKAGKKAGAGLEAVDIRVKFDGLDAKRLLNVSTVPMRRTYRAGETVRFLTTANYPAFIARAEIRIFETGAKVGHPVAVLPVQINGEATWVMPAHEAGSVPDLRDGAEGSFSYVLRVYDGQGRFDETVPLTIARSERELPRHDADEAVAPGRGEDRTAFRNIPVAGGAVTAYGRNVPPGYSVRAFGDEIPVDPDRAFVVQRILPPGEHTVDVAVVGISEPGGLTFTRDIAIPEDAWFYVALADLTVGKRMGDEGIEAVRPGEYDEVYAKGRLAFYLKGKIKGKYLLTAAADTGEDDLDDIFGNLDSQDPRQILRRLDPDDYYPVYGDDSVLVEDAPTKGKFYVRIARGDSHVMWGNYKTEITGNEFLRSERALYGASAVYRSEAATSFGERRTELRAYAAQPDTLPAHEEFLGTGGSAYFLRRQDIVEGSETVVVETRHPVTGRVVERRVLASGEDYSFDYLQGVIILRRPLASMTGTVSPVRSTALGGGKLYLTVDYEFEPVASDVDGYVYGGRVQHWLNDHIGVGVTGMDDSTDTADQVAYGADIVLRRSEGTWVSAEIARSKGRGFGLAGSTDGGLTWQGSGASYDPMDDEGTAWRVEGEIDLEEVAPPLQGRFGAYYEEKEKGFSTLYDRTSVDRRIWGTEADIDLTGNVALGFTYDDLSDGDGQIRRDGTVTISREFDEHWKLSFGVSYTELMSPRAIASGRFGYDGSRFDAGARLVYRIDDGRLLYVFGQGTFARSGDIDRADRAGVGIEWQLTDRIGLTGEISHGTHGVGALAGITYDPAADNHYYIGYKLDPDRAFDLDRGYDLSGTDRGSVVAGLKRRMGDFTSAYSESSYDMFGRRRSLTQTYGVIYTPDAMWTVDGGLEFGRVHDGSRDTGAGNEDFDRYAPSLSLTYKDEEGGIDAHLRGEVRVERSDEETRDQNTYLFAAGLGWKASPDWRLLAHIDAVLSDSRSEATSFADTDYVETSLGFAYRPVVNDRFNALFKYTWLYDLPGNNQLAGGATGDPFAPAQRSHILSADAIYDLFPWLSVGGKYGFRYGEVRYRMGAGPAFEDEWQKSSAHLGILRTDLHVVRNWDALLEGRVLSMPEADTVDYGALLAVYRHVGDNFKIGVGYNFGRFSDDLRDLTLDDGGIFLNAVGKM